MKKITGKKNMYKKELQKSISIIINC